MDTPGLIFQKSKPWVGRYINACPHSDFGRNGGMCLKKAACLKNDTMGKTSFFLPLPLRRIAAHRH